MYAYSCDPYDIYFKEGGIESVNLFTDHFSLLYDDDDDEFIFCKSMFAVGKEVPLCMVFGYTCMQQCPFGCLK